MTNIFAPFEPERDEPRRRRFKPIPVRVLLPNMVTLLSLCLGLTAIRMAMEGRLELAIGAIVLAAVLDGLDGRIARLLQTSSRFGAELDSLADFLCFGVAPGIILYHWGLGDLKNIGWITVLVFAMCSALRLARFNVMLEDPNRPVFAGNFFVGVPAPAAALVVMLPAYLHFLGLPQTVVGIVIAAIYVIGISLLMVSRIPTWSGKKVGARVPREWVLPVFVLVVLFTAILISYPWELLSVGSVLYLAAIPAAYVHYKRLERAHIPAAAAATVHHIQPDEEEQRPGRLN
ncbi:MAG: CDP-diacylglycerol--serine O-phosphatidyltransferase [Bradyrhizobiaceae bacterium]|nr:CDP-diacylglycerol--serine O-phosphatidyltransferase [Bradyrhizobiaceae bacterium]